jgi:hypothetical protein
MANVLCAACRRSIDAAARLCPYCGADPATGERLDTQAMLQEVFRPKEMTTSESVLEYARHRQGIVLAVSLLVAFLLLAGLHQFATMRNAQNVTNATAVPLTELADLQNQKDDTKPLPMPELDFQYEGRPQRMRTYIGERGAVTPPEVVAAQQAAAMEAAAKKAAAAPAPAPVPAAPVKTR